MTRLEPETGPHPSHAANSARVVIEAVLVVVPAHDEEELLGRCLTSVAAAAAQLRTARPAVLVETMVVLDRCRDGSEAVAAQHPVEVLRIDAACVGVARARGVEQAARTCADLDPARVWVASTDADTTVSSTWLTQQVDAAEAGAHLVVGRVEPDTADLDGRVHAAWHRLHPAAGDSHHVHGANLGIRLDAYELAGGFPPLREHEDAVLVAAARRLGLRVASGTTAVTSGRLQGRAGGGFAGYLRRLRAHVVPLESPGAT